LALRARLIQRKSIHFLSTGTLVAAALLAAGCAGGEAPSGPVGAGVLRPDPDAIRVGPGETGMARVVMTSGGVPVGSATVTFTIMGAPLIPGTDQPGASLSETTAMTDVSGAATIGVGVDARVGLANLFRVHAAAGSAHTDVTVVVADESAGTVVVAPFFPNPETSNRATSGITLWFVDGKRCAELDPASQPNVEKARTAMLTPTGEKASFKFVTVTRPAAALGRASDSHGELIALGCIDLSESTVLPDGVVEVPLPLRDTLPAPEGTFAVTSPIAFDPPLAAAAVVAGPWRDLSDCPLDPAQLLLDCIIDALSPETAADPLDCRPNPAPGGEGALGDALMARRGVPLKNAAGMDTGCRGARDGAGAASLDAVALALFGTPTPPLLVALPTIADDAVHILDGMTLSSTLTVQPAGRPGGYLITHTLNSALMKLKLKDKGVDMSADVALPPLALPALTAYTTATTRDGLLIVDEHGFTLRFGRVARAGFNAVALAPRLPAQATADVGGLVAEIVKLARYGDPESPLTSCAAFNALLCPANDPECLGTPCSDGLVALTNGLNGVFDAADGTGLDFYLAGSAPLLAAHGSTSAHQLGANLIDPTNPARWSLDLRTVSGRTRLSTSFVGVRN
jgi:hypothetical protein